MCMWNISSVHDELMLTSEKWRVYGETSTFCWTWLLCFCHNESSSKPYLHFRNSILKFPVLPDVRVCVPLSFSLCVPAAPRPCWPADPPACPFTASLLGDLGHPQTLNESWPGTRWVFHRPWLFSLSFMWTLWLCCWGNPLSSYFTPRLALLFY